VHMKKTNAPLVARIALPEPIIVEKEVASFDKKLMGKTFQKDAAIVQNHVLNMGEAELLNWKQAFASQTPVNVTIDGKVYVLHSGMVHIERKTIKQSVREFTPNVIEPSFGVGRILYALLEHSYWARESDIQRGVLSLSVVVAPTKVLIVPISSNESFLPAINDISLRLRKAGIFSRIDDSGASIGKRYARNDELGTPYGITVDFATVSNGTVTIRERDTTDQRIGKIDEVIDVVIELVGGSLDWDGACERLPAYSGVQAVE